jgi:hypothetical protein
MKRKDEKKGRIWKEIRKEGCEGRKDNKEERKEG